MYGVKLTLNYSTFFKVFQESWRWGSTWNCVVFLPLSHYLPSVWFSVVTCIPAAEYNLNFTLKSTIDQIFFMSLIKKKKEIEIKTQNWFPSLLRSICGVFFSQNRGTHKKRDKRKILCHYKSWPRRFLLCRKRCLVGQGNLKALERETNVVMQSHNNAPVTISNSLPFPVLAAILAGRRRSSTSTGVKPM